MICEFLRIEAYCIAVTDPEIRFPGQNTPQPATVTDMNDVVRYAGSAQQTIDLWIPDIEGLETAVLAAPWFRDVNVDAMLVEDFWILPKPDLLDVIMGKNSFLKFQELAFDSVFVRRGHPAAQSTQPMWYPPHFDQDLAVWTQRVRNEMCPQLGVGRQRAQESLSFYKL